MRDPEMTVERRVIVFMDIHDFSVVLDILEKSGGDSLGLLQEIYEGLGDVIVEYGGEIINYAGDAILCIFPADSENEVIQCSVELRRTFSSIVRARGISHDTELEIGIGSGEVAVGVFGHRSLRKKDVFGEEVNLAAMIGHHRGIAMTERVYDKIRMNYETRGLPHVDAKWRKEPFRVWEIEE